VASVKWLTRIEVIDHVFQGYFQTRKYTVLDGGCTAIVQRMAVKSEIVRPRAGENLTVGPQRIFGVAWAGEEEIARVEVSTDGGRSWSEADLLGPDARYSWTLWEHHWTAPAPGTYVLLARAVTTSGQAQPAEHDPRRGGYMINYCRPRPVEILRAAAVPAAPAEADALVYDMNAFAEANARFPLDVHLEFSHGAGI
jgi:hypothetical protein